MYIYVDDKSILGYECYLMEKVEGVILHMKEAQKRKISTISFKTIANTWLDTFVTLHQLDYKTLGLDHLGKPEGYVDRQVMNWGKQYLAAATEENISVPQKVMQWMQDNKPKQFDHSLIHNDFKYDNVVFKDDKWNEIIAVLDWEMATIGDPLMDLGTSLGYWTMASDHPFVQKGIPSPTLFDGNPSREEIVTQYEQKTGKPVNHIVFYYVFGLFKIAVIAQQIYFRYHKGLTTDPRFANLDKAANLLCDLALKSIQTKKIV